jgi:hypothetical protein
MLVSVDEKNVEGIVPGRSRDVTEILEVLLDGRVDALREEDWADVGVKGFRDDSASPTEDSEVGDNEMET